MKERSDKDCNIYCPSRPDAKWPTGEIGEAVDNIRRVFPESILPHICASNSCCPFKSVERKEAEIRQDRETK